MTGQPVAPEAVTVCLPDPVHHLLAEILSLFHKQKDEPGDLWIVGGTIRDLLLGKGQVFDLDLAVSRSPIGPAQRVARSKDAGFVVLDKEREVARIVKALEGGVVTVDFARYRAPTIEEDLRDRDFTINALAIKLAWPLLTRNLEVYDPLGGVVDLRAGRLRPCADHLFREDPLRILRAFRFGATLGFTFVPELETLMTRDAHLLKAVSRERIRDEFFKVLGVPDSHRWLRRMADLGVLREVLPELEAARGVSQNDWHHLDVFDHTLLTLEKFEELLGRPSASPYWAKVQGYLGEPISGTRTFLEAFKFGCLLHDLGKPSCRRVIETPGRDGAPAQARSAGGEGTDASGRVVFHGHETEGARLAKTIGEHLRLSVAEIQFLQKVVKNHMRPGVILQELEQRGPGNLDNERNRLLFRFFAETGRDGVGIALMSLADRLSARGQQQPDDLDRFAAGIAGFIDSFYQQTENARFPPLLTGTDLITQFRLQPGPLFKEILAGLKEAQALGTVQTREQALEFVSHLVAERKT
ncbi:MAG: CCA tRNA nucleotidyltransferase [Candidatus Riflebacteria bacterium]|nr:CCA tRNA nucleotidyltransferase [Candidatus Riflebacteria bacterium]